MLEVEPTGQRGRTATESGQNGRGISFRRIVDMFCACAACSTGGRFDDVRCQR